jgi:coenzyme A diphosphatase NUDT7
MIRLRIIITRSLITRTVSPFDPTLKPRASSPLSRPTLQGASKVCSLQVPINLGEMVPHTQRNEASERGESIGLVMNNLKAEGNRATLHRPVSHKHAAVLVPLFELNGEIRVVLTQRNAKMKTHAGEVCLPGGKREPGDADDVATALREAHEELGIRPDSVSVVTTMQPMLSKHLLSVRPVVGVVPSNLTFCPNPSEVADVFTAPLRMFIEPKGDEYWYRDVTWEGNIKYRLHYFRYSEEVFLGSLEKEFVIWGLTAGMLTLVAEKAFGVEPNFATHPPGSKPYTALTYANGRLVFGRSLHNDERASSAAVQGAVVTDEEAEAAVGTIESGG